MKTERITTTVQSSNFLMPILITMMRYTQKHDRNALKKLFS